MRGILLHVDTDKFSIAEKDQNPESCRSVLGNINSHLISSTSALLVHQGCEKVSRFSLPNPERLTEPGGRESYTTPQLKPLVRPLHHRDLRHTMYLTSVLVCNGKYCLMEPPLQGDKKHAVEKRGENKLLHRLFGNCSCARVSLFST